MITVFWNRIVRAILLCSFLAGGSLMGQAPQKATDIKSGEYYRESQILYAQAVLELARHELKIAEENKSTMSVSALDRTRNHVLIAEEQLRVAKLPVGESDTIPIRLRYAEENANFARREYLKAVAFDRDNQYAFTDSQIERLRLKAEVAKHRLNVMSNPAHLMSLLDHMHWEIDRLNEDLVALQTRVEELEKR